MSGVRAKIVVAMIVLLASVTIHAQEKKKREAATFDIREAAGGW